MIPEINQDNIVTWILAFIGFLAGVLIFIGGLKLLAVIATTSYEDNTKVLSSTKIQRWITFIVLMAMIVATHFKVTTNPLNIDPQPLSEWLVFIMLTFVIAGKVVKIWETKPVAEPSTTVQVKSETTNIEAATPAITGTTPNPVKPADNINSDVPFIMKNE